MPLKQSAEKIRHKNPSRMLLRRLSRSAASASRSRIVASPATSAAGHDGAPASVSRASRSKGSKGSGLVGSGRVRLVLTKDDPIILAAIDEGFDYDGAVSSESLFQQNAKLIR